MAMNICDGGRPRPATANNGEMPASYGQVLWDGGWLRPGTVTGTRLAATNRRFVKSAGCGFGHTFHT
jgi:hypothetical protein